LVHVVHKLRRLACCRAKDFAVAAQLPIEISLQHSWHSVLRAVGRVRKSMGVCNRQEVYAPV